MYSPPVFPAASIAAVAAGDSSCGASTYQIIACVSATTLKAHPLACTRPTSRAVTRGTWLKTVAKPRVSEQTFNSYEWLLGRITPKLGKVRLSQLRAEDIQKAYGSLPSSTARHVHAPLRSALRQAVKWHLIYANPCDSVELPRQQASETEWLTKEEAGRFLAVDGKYACLFAFLLDTGSRPSEALGLKWTDVDLEKGNLTIQRTLQWHATGGFYFGETKTKGSRRTIPLSASMARRIKEHRRTQAEKLLKIGVRSDLVFSNTEGAPLLRRNLARRHFKPALEKAKLSTALSLYTACAIPARAYCFKPAYTLKSSLNDSATVQLNSRLIFTLT